MHSLAEHWRCKGILVVFVSVSCSIAGAQSNRQAAPSLEQVLVAPASDLAMSFLNTESASKFISLAENGATVMVGSEEINPANVARFRERIERRLSTYSDAITQRGFEDLSGRYSAEAARACEEIGSVFGYLRSPELTGVEITQDQFRAQIILRFLSNGKEISIENVAAVVENAIAVQDKMNSDFYLRGELKGGEIAIAPDLSVLDSWPSWANPPKKKDLQKCIITLSPTSDFQAP